MADSLPKQDPANGKPLQRLLIVDDDPNDLELCLGSLRNSPEFRSRHCVDPRGLRPPVARTGCRHGALRFPHEGLDRNGRRIARRAVFGLAYAADPSHRNPGRRTRRRLHQARRHRLRPERPNRAPAGRHSSRAGGATPCATRRFAAASALNESEERFRTLVETAPEAIVLVEATTAFVDCNDNALTALRIQPRRAPAAHPIRFSAPTSTRGSIQLPPSSDISAWRPGSTCRLRMDLP